jgi:hypothetical protein
MRHDACSSLFIHCVELLINRLPPPWTWNERREYPRSHIAHSLFPHDRKRKSDPPVCRCGGDRVLISKKGEATDNTALPWPSIPRRMDTASHPSCSSVPGSVREYVRRVRDVIDSNARTLREPDALIAPAHECQMEAECPRAIPSVEGGAADAPRRDAHWRLERHGHGRETSRMPSTGTPHISETLGLLGHLGKQSSQNHRRPLNLAAWGVLKHRMW